MRDLLPTVVIRVVPTQERDEDGELEEGWEIEVPEYVVRSIGHNLAMGWARGLVEAARLGEQNAERAEKWHLRAGLKATKPK